MSSLLFRDLFAKKHLVDDEIEPLMQQIEPLMQHLHTLFMQEFYTILCIFST